MSPEEAVESRIRLIDEIEIALLDIQSNGHPGNFELYNALLRVMELWESRREEWRG